MHQTPELHNVILERSTSKEKTSFCIKSEQCLPSLTFEIFDILSFIKYHIIPFLSAKSKMVLNYQFIGSDTHMERVVSTPSLTFKLSFFLTSEVSQDL